MSSILIVEDEVLTSEYLRFVLEKAGYEAIPAGSAEEAIAVLEQRDDVATSSLLTSIYQGGLNGLQLAAVVRDRWPSINIIIVTGTVHPKGKRSRPICSKAVRCPENDRSGTSLPTLTQIFLRVLEPERWFTFRRCSCCSTRKAVGPLCTCLRVAAEARSGPPSVAASRFSANFVVLTRASARVFNGKSEHPYIKRFWIAAALTDQLDITHAPAFAKYLHARVSDRCDVNEHVLAAVIRLYKAVAAIFSVDFDFSGRHNPILAEFQNGCRNNNTTTDRARVAILLTFTCEAKFRRLAISRFVA